MFIYRVLLLSIIVISVLFLKFQNKIPKMSVTISLKSDPPENFSTSACSKLIKKTK